MEIDRFSMTNSSKVHSCKGFYRVAQDVDKIMAVRPNACVLVLESSTRLARKLTRESGPKAKASPTTVGGE